MGDTRPGEFELMVLLAALRLGPQRAYAVSIVDDIEGRTGRSVRRSNVYTTLKRLEEKEWVTTRMGEARPERGGKARRLVSVEAEGVEAVKTAADQIRSMWAGLESVVGEVG